MQRTYRRVDLRQLAPLAAAALLLLVGPVAAQPTSSPVQTADPAPAELLELPSFTLPSSPPPTPKITLELLPEESAASSDAAVTADTPAPAVPEEPESATAVLLPPPAVVGTEAYGPPAPPDPPAQAAAEVEVYGPPVPPVQTAATDPAASAYGPPSSPPTDNVSSPATQALALTQAERDALLPDGWNEGSIMFTPEEIALLQEALFRAKNPTTEVALENLPEGIALPTDAPAPPPPPDYTLIFVNSLMYFGPDHWTAWINGKRFFSGKDSPLERLSVEKITGRTVTLRWQPVTPRKPSPEDAENKNLRFEPDGSVLLTLAANQTFLVPAMRFLEGRGLTAEARELLAMNLTAETPAAGAAGDSAPLDATAAPSAHARDQQNAQKLISQYDQFSNALPGNNPQAP